MALEIIRKHRLWETFLYKILKVPFETLHREAELLEHSTTEELTDRIDKFLGNPEYDPHGDPIPSKDGKMPSTSNFIALQDCKPGRYWIARLHLRTEDANKFFNELNIKTHSEIEVIEQIPNMGTTVIRINNERLVINESIASHIYLKKDE
jgi:DtxR family Mn-dependent transcriptional regulator